LEKMMLNLTPHTIVLRLPSGQDIALPPSGTVARVAMIEEAVGTIAGLPLIRRRPGPVVGLPEDGKPCIVSSMVLAALPAGTPGVYAPDTGPSALRDERGQVLAVTRLVAA
jgi:hypothetical protein